MSRRVKVKLISQPMGTKVEKGAQMMSFALLYCSSYLSLVLAHPSLSSSPPPPRGSGTLQTFSDAD